ncbi:hypothetical protein [Scleromatobacter humisilvae]|uniref:DUF1127 domain-containing protein n=1 Tax=Scleromatobacter humisilvae TaxID=2897159 RepID=A0A9X1YLS3_9BURK|nr:hypothetical protein [Scleromatobacter humisilvae]MCK9688107.1 hypothetical protein [Scleromatobacter humisilvae]
MTTCTITPTVSTPAASRFLEAFVRFFSRSVVTRELVDQAWIDTGLGHLDEATLKDIGAPPHLGERERLMEAWKLAAALDATRHL